MLPVSREKHREYVIQVKGHFIQDKAFKYFRKNIKYINWPIIFFLESINISNFQDWRDRCNFLRRREIALSINVSFIMSERGPDTISTPNDTSFVVYYQNENFKTNHRTNPFLCHLNINSLHYKIRPVTHVLIETGLEIVAVSETKLADEFPKDQFFIDG